MELKTKLNPLFEPYIIIQLDKDTQKAKEELIREGYAIYVYFETPFQYRFIGCNNKTQAKEVYNKIMKNKDLYGCVVSINCVY